MSYPPARPSESPRMNNESLQPESHPTPSSQAAPSPLDWSSFMNFQTPPVSGTTPSNGAMGPPTGTSMGYGGTSNGSKNGGGGGGGSDYYGFAQSAHVNQAARQGNMSFQQPPSYGAGAGQGARNQSQSSSSSNDVGNRNYPPNRQSDSGPAVSSDSDSPITRPGDGNGNGKGKAKAVNMPSPMQRQSSGSYQVGGGGDGLSLDPAAFSSNLRFQIPSFLSNPVGGAPTFPPGGEAWSGFAGSGMGGDGNTVGGLTPGQLFSNMFNLADGNTSGYGNGSGGGMGGDGSWSASGGWEAAKDQNVGNGTYGGGPTTFYVNPNPSPNNINTVRQGPAAQGTYPPPRSSDHMPSPRSVPISNMPPSYNPQQSSQNTSMNGAGSAGRNNTAMSSAFSSFNPQVQRNGSVAAGGINSMPTSTLLGGNMASVPSYTPPFPFVPSISESAQAPASTINIASSSSAPYAPPSNTEQLLTAPIAPPVVGPSLADGPGLYSTTGFDMVGVLARVAARKDPKTVLGPVDLSCSFAVIDVRRFDHPIVYASPTFTSLTGYELPQILGRNCRFLQSPDGEVVKGSKRKYTDNVAVAHLKRMLNAGKECQASLINYRRGGIPFINLVTVVPIPWEGTDIVYHVGFQVDLVEQPNAILRNMRDGSYQVNYTVANPPQAPLRPAGREPGLSGLSADVLDIMGQRVNSVAFGQGEDGPKMDWLKMVLENSDDFVHVLSLKGLFQYVSPSVRRVLNYEPEELLNKNISDICHPSDIVPLMRELKDSTHAPSEGSSVRSVNLVFRIRHKTSGYVWIECAGRLHIEPGKGRKAVILSGRARSVPMLPWDSISRHGGLAEKEFWAKLSFQGLILHATSTASDVLGQRADEIVGQSFFSILPGGDNGPPHASTIDNDPTSPVSVVANAFQSATRSTKKDGGIMITHKLVKRSGELVDVITILYSPKGRADMDQRGSDGNSSESPTSSESPDSIPSPGGQSGSSVGRPTFLVAQIKLLSASNLPNNLLPSSSTSANSAAIANLTNARPVANAGQSNLFEELETTRGTSWQYELHQLRLLNRRLKDDVLAARNVVKGNHAGKMGKISRKRKVGEEMGPPALPSSLNQARMYGDDSYTPAAPPHQMAPGFGLVNPNMPNMFF